MKRPTGGTVQNMGWKSGVIYGCHKKSAVPPSGYPTTPKKPSETSTSSLSWFSGKKANATLRPSKMPKAVKMTPLWQEIKKSPPRRYPNKRINSTKNWQPRRVSVSQLTGKKNQGSVDASIRAVDALTQESLASPWLKHNKQVHICPYQEISARSPNDNDNDNDTQRRPTICRWRPGLTGVSVGVITLRKRIC